MGLRGSVSSRFTWILALLLCVLSPAVKTQDAGCAMVGLDLEHCLKPSSGFFSMDDTCCIALNQIVQAGYGCVCSLIAASPSLPLLGIPMSLLLSNCFISAPPLTQCQVVAPTAVVLPPDDPHKEITQPSGPTDPLNSTGSGNDNADLEAKQPQVTETDDDNPKRGDEIIPNREDKAKLNPLPMLLLSLALEACRALY